VTSALQHSEIGAKRSDIFAILMCHDASKLMQMREIVGCPGGKQL
jgi:hypothetical protein